MFRNTLMTIVTAALLAGGTVVAGEIYKWTDEDGNIHYEDRPIADEVERLNVISRSTDNASVQASIDARREHEVQRMDARTQRDEAKQAAAEAKAIAEQREVQCQASRSRMERYLRSRRLYRQDEAGERVYLDEEQIMEAREDTQEMIQKYCD